MILNDENVMTMEDGTTILVLDPATDAYVECWLRTSGPDGVFLTTTSSDIAAYESTGSGYREHIKHLRGINSHAALMTREKMAQLLINRQYTFC